METELLLDNLVFQFINRVIQFLASIWFINK